LAPAAIDLARLGVPDQSLAGVLGGLSGAADTAALRVVVGILVAGGLAAFVFASREFRRDRDNILGGAVVGLAIVAGWFITAGPLGAAWKDWAALAEMPPSRVATQSFTFVSPMADLAHYLKTPGNLWLLNFGICALAGVIAGSFLHAVLSGRFRIEWFASVQDVARHIFGALFMGFGAVLALGSTIGQGVTGLSTLALGSILGTVSFVVGAGAVLRWQ